MTIELYKEAPIKVQKGDEINPGDLIGNIGHSGNSTAPHLHFYLMDRADPITAKGIPCCFGEYELYHKGNWIKVEPSNTCVWGTENSMNFRVNGIPKNKDRIRF